MKTKKSTKEMTLKKITIANLDNQDLNIILGGNYSGDCDNTGSYSECTPTTTLFYKS